MTSMDRKEYKAALRRLFESGTATEQQWDTLTECVIQAGSAAGDPPLIDQNATTGPQRQWKELAGDFSFCETVTASGTTPWHIRRLTQAGQFLGGGADTLALCGRSVSWDIRIPIKPDHLHAKMVCLACRERFAEIFHSQGTSPQKKQGDREQANTSRK